MSVGEFFSWVWANLLPISVIASAVVTVTTVCLRSTFAVKSDVTSSLVKVHKRIDQEAKEREKLGNDLRQRIVSIEGSMESLATKDDVNRVLVALERQDGDRKALAEKVEGVKEQLGRIERPLDLIQEYLLNRERR